MKQMFSPTSLKMTSLLQMDQFWAAEGGDLDFQLGTEKLEQRFDEITLNNFFNKNKIQFISYLSSFGDNLNELSNPLFWK